MVTVEAHFRVKNKQFEISVDFEEAMKVKSGKGVINTALVTPKIFYNAKSGDIASQKDLMDAFGTSDIMAVATTILERGMIQKPQEFRDTERENKVKQVVTLLMRNAVDQHGRPYTEDRLRKAITEVHYNFDNKPAEQQMLEVLEKIKLVIPIRVDTKRIKLVIPARFSGQVYGLLKDYKESEDWLVNGDLQVIISIPAGMQLDFYDKLNSVTHGAVVSEEVIEKK